MTFHIRTPSDARIRAWLRERADAPFTYPSVGLIREDLDEAPSGFVLDRYGAEVGPSSAFDRAREALGRIANYPPSFTRVVRAHDVLSERAIFATVASHLGFYSVHPCRVIFVVDEPDRYGFGFGTLPGHAESGEERFLVTRIGEHVHYDVQAYSRPTGLSRLGSPIARHYQRRFQRETVAHMRSLLGG